MSTRWLKFSRKFNFTPKGASAVTIQHGEGDVASVTNEHAEKALAKNAAIEIQAPANAEEAAKLKSGELEPTPLKSAKGDKADGADTAPTAKAKP